MKTVVSFFLNRVVWALVFWPTYAGVIIWQHIAWAFRDALDCAESDKHEF